ncbi:MAG: hypothetical protein JSU57_05365 [Candidatus Heimdallarchaeota archaeon]|nr:MAG: hypothetical protein JSU57_05365 [Candidatus Heimdallarchaeota archaeon]
MINQTTMNHVLPSKLKVMTIGTLSLAVLGLLLGLPLLLFNLDLPSMEGLEHDTREYNELSIRYTMRFFGVIATFLGTVGLIGGFLTYKRSRLGWLILVGLYFSGVIGCLYIFYRLIMLIIDYSLNSWLLIAAIPSPITVVMVWGVFALFILFHKQTIDFVFR